MSQMTSGIVPEWTMGDRLRKARELTGLDQRDFADTVGVSRQTITNAEKGHHGVRKITLNAWALATGVSVRWLETGIVDTPTSPPDDGSLPRLDSNQQPFGYALSLVRKPARHLSPVRSAAA